MNDLYKTYEDYKSRNEFYLQQAKNDIDYYLGNHYTAEQLRVLKQRKQSPSVANYAYSLVYTQMSIMGANPIEFRAIARDDNDVKKTKLINDVLSYISYVSDGPMQVRQAIATMLTGGRGNIGVFYDPYGDDGTGEIKYKHLPLEDVYYDPRAKDVLGRDCEYIFQRKVLPVKTAVANYPEFAMDIQLAARSRSTLDAFSGSSKNPTQLGTHWGVGGMEVSNDQSIECIEAYQINQRRVHIIYSGNQKLAEVEQEQIQEAMAALQAQGAKITDIKQANRRRVMMSLMFGQKVVASYELPISDFPIVPMVNMWSGNLFPFGDIRQVKTLNDEVNKMRSLRIQHMATAVNGRLIARKGIFEKEGAMEANLARPGAVIYANTMSDDISKDLMFLSSGTVSPDNYNHEEISKRDMESVSGVYEMQQGGSATAPETFRGILAMDEYGQRKLRYKLKNVEDTMGQVGKVALEWAQNAYGTEKTIRIVQPEWNSQEEQARYEKLNIPIFDDYGDVIEYMNDISVGKYDVVVKGGSTMPTNRWAEMQAYKEDFQMGIIDDIEYIKKTDIYDRQGLLERKSLYSQQKQQLEQLSSMIEELEKQAAQLDEAVMSERKDKEVQQVRFQEMIRLLKAELQNANNVGKVSNRIEKTAQNFEAKMKELEIKKKEQQAKSTTKPKK